MPLISFIHATCYTWYFVTSRRECNSSSFLFLLLVCLSIKVATIILQSQPPNLDVILTQSRVFHTDLSHQDFGDSVILQ